MPSSLKKIIQDGGSRRKIELKEKISVEYRVWEPEPSNEPVDVIPPPPRRSSRVSHPLERYLGILTKDFEEAFLFGNRDIKNDPKTYDEAMLDIDSEKWMEVMKLLDSDDVAKYRFQKFLTCIQ